MEQRAFMLPTEIGLDEISLLSGVSKSKLNRLILCADYNFPQKIRLVNRCRVFDRADVLRYLGEHNIAVMRVQSKIERAEPVKSLFNLMAVRFITRTPAKGINVTRETCQAKTITVHLHERDDYTPPHRGFELFRTGDSYRVACEGGEW